jgi:hypothetical protein
LATVKHPPELRPYRVAMYAIAGAAVLWFIGCIIWSVHRGTARAAPSDAPASAAACADQLDAMSRDLAARAAASDGHDWSDFSAAFEPRVAAFQARCVEAPPADASPAFRASVREAAEAIEDMRAHLSRCGEEADKSRASVGAAIEKVRAAAGR